MQRPARIRAIAERAGLPIRGQLVLVKGRYQEFPVARVPQAALIYRFDNGRLAAELEEHVARVANPLKELRAAQETPAVQRLLHGLLLKKAEDQRGPIFAELERLGQQTEPLLVLFDGVVVNGNRRLAAMRELIGRDAARYAAFAEIAVTVLPEGTEADEIEYVEAALQMAPETKLGYGWLDRRLKLRRQRDVLRLPVEQIMDAYRIADSSEIQRELGELELAEAFLATYKGEPSRYSAIAEEGPLFVGLREQLAKLSEPRRSFWRLAGFAMIHGRDRQKPNDPQRHYPFCNPVPADVPAAGLRRIAERLGVAGADDLTAMGEPNAQVLSDAGAIFQDRARSAATAKLIAATLDELRLEFEERKAPDRMLHKVRETGRLIARLEPERLSAEQRRRLRGDLAALQSHAAYLLGQMEEKPSVPGRWNYPKNILRPPYSKVPWRIMRRLGWAEPARSPGKRT